MGGHICEKDWELTALGAVETWSWELLSMVSVMLSSPIPMFIYWGAELIVLYNDAAIPTASAKHPRSLGNPAREVWKEAWHIIGPELSRVIAGEGVVNNYDVLVPIERDGAIQDLYWNYSYSPVFEKGRIGGVLVICQDVTPSVTARHERATVAAKLRQTLETTTDSVLNINRDWTIAYMNPPARATVEVMGDAIGRGFWEAFPATIYEGSPYVEHYYRAMDEGIFGEFEAFYPAPLEIWVRVQVRPTEEGIVLFFRDITEQKKAAAALLLTEKLTAVGRLAASIAHEINNPLESVTNLLYLARGSENISEVQDYLDTAGRELRRVSIIANQTLRFYKQSTKAREVQADELIKSVLSIFHGKIVNSKIGVDRKRSTQTAIECFEDEIRQVLNNLVGNAIDAMSTGGQLSLRSREVTDWKTNRRGLQITVADTGEGIAPRHLLKVFDAFYTTKGSGGTGLGLWVSQEIIQRHHGRLRARSSQKEGKSGTVFQLFLPFDAAKR